MSSSNIDSHRRVVITGLGVICPLGNSPESLWESLSSGRSGIQPLKNFPPLDTSVRYGAEADQFTGHINDFGDLPKNRKKAIRKGLKVMCRETMMAVAAAQHAVLDADYESEENTLAPERAGVVFGSDYMLSNPQDLTDGMVHCHVKNNHFQFSEWGSTGLNEMNPLWMLKYLPNMPGSHIAIFNDLRGPNNSLTLREIAGLMAIREAALTIQRNHADRMIAGATGTRIHPFKTIHAIFSDQLADPALSPEQAARPFDKHRTGMVIGEGAAALVLEELESARSRGATIYAEVLGSGSSTVTDSNLRPQPQAALTAAMRAALSGFGNQSSEHNPTSAVGHINAHGLGTQSGDQSEARAIADVFGQTSSPIPVVAAKSYFGNLGASGGIAEVIASLLALGKGKLFPTLNYETPDPLCPLSVVKDNQTPAGESFLKMNITPQGQAAALLLGLPD